MKLGDPLLQLGAQFALLSLIAVGGANTVVPEMHRFVVETHGWMSSAEFADLFAIAQAAPGPNVMIVSLLGWRIAGLPGALVATAGMCGPSCLLTYFVARVWQRFRAAPWRIAVQAGLAPLTVGLVLASGYILTRAADHSLMAYGITGMTTLLVLKTKRSPLWYLGTGGLLGCLGLV